MWIIAEIKIELSFFFARLKSSWVNKRWISSKEFNEIRRGN